MYGSNFGWVGSYYPRYPLGVGLGYPYGYLGYPCYGYGYCYPGYTYGYPYVL